MTGIASGLVLPDDRSTEPFHRTGHPIARVAAAWHDSSLLPLLVTPSAPRPCAANPGRKNSGAVCNATGRPGR